MPRRPNSSYEVRKSGGGPESPAYNLNVPRGIVAVLPPNARFAVELTEEGILYRFVGSAPTEFDVPSWAKAGA